MVPNNITRLTRGAWPALPVFTKHATARRSGSGRRRWPRPGLSCAAPSVATSDARGRVGEGGGVHRCINYTHTHTRRCSTHSSTTLIRASEQPKGTTDSGVLVRKRDAVLLQPRKAGKSFDPKTSSTRPVTGFRFPTNPQHTQKTDPEPPRIRPVMQKSHSPDVTFVITFMMTNNTHTRLPWHALKNRQSRDKLNYCRFRKVFTTNSISKLYFQSKYPVLPVRKSPNYGQ